MKANSYLGSVIVLGSLVMQLSCRTNHKRPEIGQIPSKPNPTGTTTPGSGGGGGGGNTPDKPEPDEENEDPSTDDNQLSNVGLRPEVSSAGASYLPKCTASGIKNASYSMKYESGSGTKSRMVVVSGGGFSCKTNAELSDNSLPLCSVACASQDNEAEDWGWCSNVTSFQCKP